ncbi:MAG: site-specific DNA-methyltransferase [Synergistaceae bacterium]|nr:site-specific DNA-methyltransferase [Synergistaceae bacterium]
MKRNREDPSQINLPSAEGLASSDGPVTCLGMTFASDEARRAHFTEELRKKLQAPEFRRIEGFPIGADEDILALSDPPYYTACPNPWISDFVAEWEAQKPKQSEGYTYHREPFAADVSEGKNDPVYNAHSYHTKVPHKAIMRYILHYTEPGDIVFDGFCGTGMTGVAAQMCGDRDVVESLGYLVEADGTILQREADDDGNGEWKPFSKLGARRAVLNDLSPAATFIAYNYNTPVDVTAFEQEARRILNEVEAECGWMYGTLHTDEKTKKQRQGKINYTVWSDVFVCPDCTKEVVFWEAAVDKKAGNVRDEFPCPHCGALLTKRRMERAWVSKYDATLREIIRQAKQVPVLINYSVAIGAKQKRFEKTPDAADLALIEKIENSEIPYWFPTDRMMEGQETRRNDPIGITHVHHFYTKRNLWVIATTLNKLHNLNFVIMLLSVIWTNTKLYRYRWAGGFAGAGGGPLAGTLFIPSLIKDISLLKSLSDYFEKGIKKKRLLERMFAQIIMTNSLSENLKQLANSADYIFTDPPFGSNLNYSELNFLWESWLKVFTNNKPEAIENDVQRKGPAEYRQLMTACFKEAYRVLKPGHWMTVEFSNTRASVWNSIQTALSEAGFILANVSALDKKQGSFKAVTTPTAVKQDLVISAYKPNGGFEERFVNEAQTEEGIWDFVRTHLGYLPVTKLQGNSMQPTSERDPRILFDQMVSYYVRKGYLVPVSSQDFQAGLQRFSERDGMYFLPEQAAEYDRRKLTAGGVAQLSLFVSDEASAIQWLRKILRDRPQTFQDIHPQFLKEIAGWSKNEEPLELSTLLEQNFLRCDGKGPVPEQVHAYLSSNWKDLRNLPKDDPTLLAKARDRWYVPDPNKAGDLEKLREKALLREFEEYKTARKKLRVFRLEAVRAGFRKAWQERDYAVIVSVAGKIPNNVLEEDPKLLMWYDQAITRMGGE